MLDRRLQVLIDQNRRSRLEREGCRQGVPVAVLAREAIDERFPGGADKRREAVQAVLDAGSTDVPGPDRIREELEGIRGRLA